MPMRRGNVGWVYFVRAPVNRFIKIGFTGHHPDYRLWNLSAGSPVPLVRLGVLRGDRETEHRLHLRFVASRHHSEWFESSPALEKFIHEKLRPWPEPVESFQEPDPEKLLAAYQEDMDELIDWALAMRYQRSWKPIEPGD